MDLSLVGCYNLTFMNEEARERSLQSAKSNLKNMAFFGLTEFQRKTQFLFERTFNLKFISPFTQFNITRGFQRGDQRAPAGARGAQLPRPCSLYSPCQGSLPAALPPHQAAGAPEETGRGDAGSAGYSEDHRGHRWPKQEGNLGAVTEDYNSQVVRW